MILHGTRGGVAGGRPGAPNFRLMDDRGGWLIYGATGYTGRLIVRLAVERGLRPIVAGRDPARVVSLAAEFNLAHRTAPLADPGALDALLSGVSVVLHCAGPFIYTARPMVEACLRARAHYLDITGEIPVFEAIAARDREARAAGVMLLPGVGFDVVPSDCLAAHLKRRLPTATRLTLAFHGRGSRPSRGTATTALAHAPRGGFVRRGGALVRVPLAHARRPVDFGQGPVPTVAIPWGDVATAFHSTGIPDIEVLVALPPRLRRLVVLARYVPGVLRFRAVRALAQWSIDAQPPGPSAAERGRGASVVWGEAVDASGRRAAARLRGPEGYTLTAETALAVIRRVLAGAAPAGFQTPSRAYGPDFILQIAGVTREDLD